MDSVTKRPTEAFYGSELFDDGMTTVVIARFKTNRQVEIGVFLLDLGCLGFKNGFFTRIHETEYDTDFLEKVYPDGDRQSLSPACARRLVEGAVAYAQSLGFAPHPDYSSACRVLGGIDSTTCDQTYEYGKDGQPFYCQGPNDSREMVHRVMTQLRAKCGEGHFKFLLLGPIR